MFAVQLVFLVAGVVVGPVLALRLRRQVRAHPKASARRTRMMVGFGAGAAMWVVWAFFFLSGEIAWLFLGTLLAIYLPTLIVIAATPATPPRDRAAR